MGTLLGPEGTTEPAPVSGGWRLWAGVRGWVVVSVPGATWSAYRFELGRPLVGRWGLGVWCGRWGCGLVVG